MKRITIALILLLSLTACESVKYIAPALPDYSPVIPNRPELYAIDETLEIPKEINMNLVLLMGYCESLENVIDNWSVFYNELKTIYKNDNAKQI